MRKQELIFAILQAQTEQNGQFMGKVCWKPYPMVLVFCGLPITIIFPGLMIFTFRRARFVGSTCGRAISSPAIFALLKEGERYFALLKVESINYEDPERAREKILFDNLTPLYPNASFSLEYQPEDYTTCIVDLLTPVGKGQRGLIVAAPRTGKTMMLQHLAKAIAHNHKTLSSSFC